MTQITLKGNPVHTIGQLPSIGDTAFDFILVDKDLKNVSLKDFSGIKILSTVPSLDTAVCAASAKRFNEIASKMPNVTILTISSDLPFAQKRFCEAEKIDKVHTLSMMRSRSFGKDYGVLIKDGPLEGILARSILVLDEKNKIVYEELVNEITEQPDYEKVLAALNSI